jgi:PleD family two-component response regulator
MGYEETVDSLIKRVDEAMYKAKHYGKNRVCISDE